MRFFIFTLLVALFFVATHAVKQQKAVIITYPEDTPDHEVDKAIDVLKEAGGVVTHEYSKSPRVRPARIYTHRFAELLKGFAAKASDAALEAIKTLGEKYVPFIEEDSIVSIDGTVLENGKSS